ncbi:hypothetical protein GJ496_000056 [Pomphorhynchus laevis]|nr:hypothetical protein GJ496_000056 [Pomphorhynchus laevis]
MCSTANTLENGLKEIEKSFLLRGYTHIEIWRQINKARYLNRTRLLAGEYKQTIEKTAVFIPYHQVTRNIAKLLSNAFEPHPGRFYLLPNLSNSSIQLTRALRDYYGKIYNTTPSKYNIDLYDRCTRRKCKKLSSLYNRYVNVKELANIEHHPNRIFNKRKSRRQKFVHNSDQYLKNISDRHLTGDQKTVLALGLNFSVGQREFARKMLLEYIRQTCVKCFDSIENHDDKIKPNNEHKSVLPLNLLRGLKSLRAMEDVVITPADKGGKVVIWSRESYIKKGLRHLQSDVYVAAVDDDLVIANESVSAILAKGVFENILSMKQMQCLLRNIPKPGRTAKSRDEALEILKDDLLVREYAPVRVYKEINKGRNFDRNDLLNNRNNKQTQRAVCVLPYHSALYDLQRNMLRAYRQTRLDGRPPIVFFKNTMKIRDIMVRSKVEHADNVNHLYHSHPCKRPRCKSCAIVPGLYKVFTP